MARSKYFFLAIVIFSIGTVGAFILPHWPVTCTGPNCRDAASANWDFSVAPERKLMTFASPEGFSTVPTP